MKARTLIVIVRQAGSAAGIIPAAEELLGNESESSVSLVVIAFPQAVATCKEVADQPGQLMMHAVKTEDEARSVFAKNIGKASLIITGTSAEAEADAYYWRAARKHKVESIAYLDQWVNIDQRFLGFTQEGWPDHLAVIDTHDERLARAIAPDSVQIHITGSPALDRIKREVDRLRVNGIKADPNRFVFATEPVTNLELYRLENGFCDEDSFDLLVALMRFHHPSAILVMRLHPRDGRERWLPKLPADIRIEWDNETRANCLAHAGKIFGMRSFFLLEALAAGVPVVSLQPNKKTYCPLTDGRMPVVARPEDYRI